VPAKIQKVPASGARTLAHFINECLHDNGLRQLNPNTIFIIFVLVEVSFKISLIRISMRTDRTTKQEWGTLRQIFGEGWENLGCHYI
jgi:hypothetical protein